MTESRRGRPRSPVVHAAILDATRALLIANGYADVSMDRVASRARVGKQTLYRRWPSKAQLVAEAVMDAYHEGGSSNYPTPATSPRTYGIGYSDMRTPWRRRRTLRWFVPWPPPRPTIPATVRPSTAS